MKMFGSVLRRIILGIGIATILLTIGVAIYTHTDQFRNLLRDQLVQTLNTEFQGTFGLERVAGSIWGDLVLQGLSVHYAEREVIAIPRVGVRYALRPFLQGRVEISHIEAFSPIVKITQSDDDSWDVVDAFASRDPAPEPSQPSTLAILLPTILLHEAQIELTLADESPQTLHFTQANLDLGLRILPAGLEAQVRQFTAQLTAPDVPPVQLAATLAYQDTTTPATLSITTFDARSAASAVQLTGGIPNFAPLTVDAALELKKLATTDLQPFLPGVTLNTHISGILQIRGPQDDLATHVMLSAGKAKVTADVRADLSQAEPRYTGTVQIAQLDPRKLLGASLPAGIIKGTLQATGIGSSLAGLDAQADLHIAALQVDTWQLGNVSLNGSVANKRAKLQGKVQGGLGQAAWDGTLDLLAKPLYELNLSVDQLDLQQVSTSSTGQDALTGQLTLSGRVKGEGFNLPDMNTQVELAIRPSTIGPVRIEQGRLVGTIAHGRIRIADTRLTANDTVLAVSGELGTAITQTGQITYSLHVGNVAPWLSLAGQEGHGSLSLTGEAAGTLAALQTSGTLHAKGLTFGQIGLKSGQLNFTVETKENEPPQGKLTAQLSGLNAGVELQQVQAEMTSQPGANLSAQIDLSAEDAAGRDHAVKATLTYEPEQLSVQLNTLRLSLPNGTWQLAQAARLVQRPTGISVEHFELANGDQQLRLDGSYATTGAQNLELQIDRFALASLHSIVPQSADITGFVSAHIQIAGTAAAPEITGTTEFSSLRIAGQDYAGLSAQIVYTNSRATTELIFQQDAAHALQASGSLALALQWASGFEARPLGDIDLKIRSSGLNLAVLNAFSGKAVTGIAGQLVLDISFQGPLSGPRPRGTFQIQHGQAEVKPLGVKISTISLDGSIEPGTIRIDQLTVQSGKGSLHSSGTIGLQGYAPHSLSFALSADRWPAIKTRQYNVRIGADLRCEGQISPFSPISRSPVMQPLPSFSLGPCQNFRKQTRPPTNQLNQICRCLLRSTCAYKSIGIHGSSTKTLL